MATQWVFSCQVFTTSSKKDYLNWTDLDKYDYKERFNKICKSIRKHNIESDINISDFIENNFNKVLLFRHSLHPTNILLYELWRSIFNNLNINIDDYEFNINYNEDIINHDWINPFTNKMKTDLDIQYEVLVDDLFYINRYNINKHLFIKEDFINVYCINYYYFYILIIILCIIIYILIYLKY